MKLLYQTHSPFARKVLVFAHEAGIAGDISVVHHETSPTRRNETVYKLNPLGKVPVLIPEDGSAIFDSAVICAYLDTLGNGPALIPHEATERFRALRLQALADGLSETGIAARWEAVRRPDHLRYQPLLDGFLQKISATFDFLETNETLRQDPTIGEIALATSLSWLEFRALASFKSSHPKLAKWYRAFSNRESMTKTALSGDTHD